MFIIFGSNRLVVDIHCPTYARYLCWKRRAALHDPNFVQSIADGATDRPRWSENGVRVRRCHDSLAGVSRCMADSGPSVVINLTPDGDLLC